MFIFSDSSVFRIALIQGDCQGMARNVEIKARIESVESIAQKVAALADEGPVEIFQDDTFFACQNGWLKLRAFSASEGEVIFYRRPDQTEPKVSFNLISRTLHY